VSSQSGHGRPDPASGALALSELLQALGGRAMALQAAEERDPEKLRLYARIVVNKAPAGQKAAIRSRLERLGLL
jgi:hypothetical protein